MKFGKNLQRVVEIADPEWAPYWPNYKMLKKLIKGIQSSLPPAAASLPNRKAPPTPTSTTVKTSVRTGTTQDSPLESSSSAVNSVREAHHHQQQQQQQQQHHQSEGDDTSEQKQSMGEPSVTVDSPRAPRHHAALHSIPSAHQDNVATSSKSAAATAHAAKTSTLATLGTNPGEVAFFIMLHTEVKKATHFFDQAQQEYVIREERVCKGMEIMTQQHAEYGSYATEDRWPRLAQSIFRLYRELLLLETFAIMAYCGFSKILKKHDKLTGHTTKNAFMAKIVNQANFVNYPRVLEMITRCERLYEDVSLRLVQDGQQELYEDERLFIHMIHRLNQQCVMPGSACSPSSHVPAAASGPTTTSQDNATTGKSRKLQELVAEIEQDHATTSTTASSDVERASKAGLKEEGKTGLLEKDDAQQTRVTPCNNPNGTSSFSKDKGGDLLGDQHKTESDPNSLRDSRKRKYVETKDYK